MATLGLEVLISSNVLTTKDLLLWRSGGSDADGTEYVGALSQRVFQTIAAAANDMAAVFGDDTPELCSLLVVWALQVWHAAYP